MQLPDRVVVYEIDSDDRNDMMYHQKVIFCNDVISPPMMSCLMISFPKCKLIISIALLVYLCFGNALKISSEQNNSVYMLNINGHMNISCVVSRKRFLSITIAVY